MNRGWQRFVLALACGACARAQPPAIFQGGVYNAASQIHPALPGGALAPGARFIVEGIRFRPPVEVRITSAHRTVSARLLSQSGERLEGLMPDDAPLGETQLVVTAAGQPSVPFDLNIVDASPGIFPLADEAGAPAHKPGASFRMLATGLGSASRLEVYVGGKRAASTRAGERKDGIDTLRVVIPRGTKEGCNVPVLARAGTRVSNTIILAVRRADGPCLPRPEWPFERFSPGARAGLIVLTRSAVDLDLPSAEKMSFTVDDAAAAFLQVTPGASGFAPLRELPPPGACITYAGIWHTAALLTDSLPEVILHGVNGNGLDAGEITVEGPAGKGALDVGRKGFYGARLGGETPIRKPKPLFLEPGELSIAGTGGSDVDAFRTTLDSPLPFRLRNTDRLKNIDRAKGFTVEWSDVPPDRRIGILLMNADHATAALGMCFCLAESGQTAFTVPPLMLANVPPSSNIPGSIPMDLLTVLTVPTRDARVKLLKGLAVRGLEQMVAVTAYARLRNVNIR